MTANRPSHSSHREGPVTRQSSRTRAAERSTAESARQRASPAQAEGDGDGPQPVTGRRPDQPPPPTQTPATVRTSSTTSEWSTASGFSSSSSSTDRSRSESAGAPPSRPRINLVCDVLRRETGLPPFTALQQAKTGKKKPSVSPEPDKPRRMELFSSPEALHFPNDPSTVTLGGLPFRTRPSLLQVTDRQMYLVCTITLMQQPTFEGQGRYLYDIPVPRYWTGPNIQRRPSFEDDQTGR
jgi:hypothetical protein